MPSYLIKTPLRTAPGTTLKPGKICELGETQGDELVAIGAVVKVEKPKSDTSSAGKK